MITIKQFFQGRDVKYASDLTPEILANSANTVSKANDLLAYFGAQGGRKERGCNSGWRPPAVNALITRAAKKSNHMLGLAIDIEDFDRQLCNWLMTEAGQSVLATLGLWMEHPSATRSWAHLQTVPPRSGKRVFHP